MHLRERAHEVDETEAEPGHGHDADDDAHAGAARRDHEQVRRRVFHCGEETGRSEACFGAQERQGNHGGAGEQGREDDAPSGDHEDDEQGQRREVVELALDGAQFGDEVGRRAAEPMPERLKVDHGEQGQVIEHGGQERGLADAQVADAGVFGHDEGDAAHDRGHDQAAG